MRVLLVNDYYPPQTVGGAEVVVAELAAALIGRGHEVTVLTSFQAESLAGEEIRSTGALARYSAPGAERSILSRAERMLLAPERVVPVLAEALAGAGPFDVVHTHNLRLLGLSAWTWLSAHVAPVVHTAHDYFMVCPFSGMYRGGRRCEEACGRCALYHVRRQDRLSALTGLTAPSRHVLELLEAKVDGVTRVPWRRVVPNGVSLPKRMAQRTLATDGALRVGYLGRLVDRKGIHAFLAAASRPYERPIRFLVAGRGEGASQAAVEAAAARGDIIYLGHTDREAFFDQIDLLVVPSEWDEPFGLVISEAQLRGVPVLTSARGALPEMLAVWGGGEAFEGEDLGQALSGALVRLCADPDRFKAWLTRLDRPSAEGMGWADAAAAYEELYLTVVADGQR